MKMFSMMQRGELRQQITRHVYNSFFYLILLIFVNLHGHVKANDIPGAPAALPPEVLGDFSFLLSNNFFFVDGQHELDEYRTNQIGFQFNIFPRWDIVFDYSILTMRTYPPTPTYYSERIDQVSLSLMYELYRTQSNPDDLGIIELGTGFRSYGNFDGGKMHSGFHHLFNIDDDDYPYVDTKTTVGTLLLKGDYQKLQPLILSDDYKTSWRIGYWVGATGLISTDNQRDFSLSANALMRKKNMTLWLGIREDWRENYDLNFVQQATSWSESGTSLVFGIGNGPLLFETAQGVGDKLSYSRFVLTSVENEYASAGYPVQANNAVALNFLMPDFEVELQYKRALPYQLNSIGHPHTWLVLDMHYGNPTYDESFDVYHPTFQPSPIYNVYSETQQLAIGIELEWYSQKHYRWISPYFTLLAGQQTEQIRAEESALAGQESAKVSSAVFEVGTGIRINLYSQQKWQLLFQTGIVANYPISPETVTLDQNDFDLLQPNLAVSLGGTLNFRF